MTNSPSRTIVAVAVLAAVAAGCGESVVGPSEEAPRVSFAHVNCDVPDPDPDCGEGGGAGEAGDGVGAKSMYYDTPHAMLWGSYRSFPYALIGTSPWMYQMEVSYLSSASSHVQGDALWGSSQAATWLVGNNGTFNIPTSGGAGQPQIRMKSTGPLGIRTQVTCTNCR